MSNSKKSDIIFFAPILSYPPATGPEISVINAIKCLSVGANLHLVSSVSRENLYKNETRDFLNKFTSSYCSAVTSFWWSKNNILNKWLRRTRRFLSLLFGLIDAIFIFYQGRKKRIDVFWIDRALEISFFVILFLRIFHPKAKIIGDTEAVHSKFVSRELPLIDNPFRYFYIYVIARIAQYHERLLIKIADVITVVSDVDGDYFRDIKTDNHRATIMRFSNVVDLDAYKDCGNKFQSSERYLNVMLIGQFGNINSPMDRAAKWMIDDILPIVRNSFPDLLFTIIGRNSDKMLGHYSSDNIKVLGEVKDLVPHLRAATMTVVPLQFESGTRFKIIESGAASLACVSTSLGAEGLNVTHGENILIADESTSFAEAIIRLLTYPKLRQKLGSNLHELVRRDYSLEKQISEGEVILERLRRACDV